MDTTTHIEPPRVLGLPAEIRDDIYEAVLIEVPTPTSPDARARINTNILFTSKQVFREAKDVILRRARLVRIKSYGMPLVISKAQAPIFALKYDSLCIMTHNISWTTNTTSTAFSEAGEDWDFITLHRNLDLFCQQLVGGTGVAISPRLAVMADHNLTLRNPFGRGDPFMSLPENQRRILEPYRTYLREVHAFSVTTAKGAGLSLDKGLVRAVEEDIMHEAVLSPRVFLDELNRLKALGTASWRRRDVTGAVTAWSNGLELSRSIRSNRKAWPGIEAAAAAAAGGYAEAVTEVIFQLACNRLAADIQALRMLRATAGPPDYDHDYDSRAYLLDSVMQCGAISAEVGELFGAPDWEPSPAQEAKVSYRLAVGIRLGAGQLGAGHGFINRALRISPNDVHIQREKAEYEMLGEVAMEPW